MPDNRKVRGGPLVLTQVRVGDAPVVVGQGMLGIQTDGLIKVLDSSLVLAELRARQERESESASSLAAQLQQVERQLKQNQRAEMELVGLRIRVGEDGTPLVSEEVFAQQMALIHGRRTWLQEERQPGC